MFGVMPIFAFHFPNSPMDDEKWKEEAKHREQKSNL
jgi:hypothetical protein